MENLEGSNQIRANIIQIILNSSNSQFMLSAIASKLGQFFQVDACLIFCHNVDSFNPTRIGLWHEQQLPMPNEDRLVPFLSKLAADRASKKQLIIVNDRQQHLGDLLVQQFGDISAKAWLGIVTHFQGKANGLVLLFKSQPHQWTSSEQEILIDVSESMAIAISQIQLQQQAKTRTRYQKLLNHLGRAISQNSDVNSLFQLTVSEIGKALEVDRSFILMLKYKDPRMTQRNSLKCLKANVQLPCYWSSTTKNSVIVDNYSFNLSDSSLCQKALSKAPESLAITEHALFPDLPQESLPDFLRPNNSSALLMMPLMGNLSNDGRSGLVLGFIVLQYNKSRLWLTEELDLVNWIGFQISTAIIHHQTLNQVQSLVEERTAQLKWSLDVQAKLSEKMRQQIEQLRQLNELKDDFLSSMSHELKTPLTSMKMAIKMLRQAQLPEPMREKYLNILEQEWNREYSLIKDLLTLQKVESGEFTVHPQELNLNQIAQELAQAFNQKWQPDKGLTLETNFADSSLILYTDAESLQHIFNELLLNAGKYSDPDTTLHLGIAPQVAAKSKQITITLSNYGAGIAAEELPYIFDKFRRGQGVTDRAVPGTGLGLALVKYLVDHLNGAIDVKSEKTDDPGVFLTTFMVTLPQFQSA
ncbi:MAG: GAF domain-containing sensor histidine kinase [Xenococcaceae cyanobacterium MO_188.B29]|nr:GAF domain-containing sensor histidine kinase [Xenococcaceae cyanobacterium MO_188.B29]